MSTKNLEIRKSDTRPPQQSMRHRVFFSGALRAAALLLLAGASTAFVVPSAFLTHQSKSSRASTTSLTERWRASASQEEEVSGIGRERRALAGVMLSTALSQLVPQSAGADIMDAVTGDQKSQDFLARLKVGKVFLPNLRCRPGEDCWKPESQYWYDFPLDLSEGFVTTPSGLKIKDLPPQPEMAATIAGSPAFSIEEGTNNIEVFSAGYIVDGATPEAVAAFLDPKSKRSKFFDVRNRDPRLFQIQNIVLGLGKSNLIPGFLEGVSTMKVGMRRVLIVPPALGYKDKAINGPAFIREIPPNSTLVFSIQVNKILR